jgi:hypothetical protein
MTATGPSGARGALHPVQDHRKVPSRTMPGLPRPPQDRDHIGCTRTGARSRIHARYDCCLRTFVSASMLAVIVSI